MDSIDFESYLLENYETINKDEDLRYKRYLDQIKETSDIVDNLPKEIQDNDIIKQLFDAKKRRLEGRKQTNREEEKKKYFNAEYQLCKGLSSILKSDYDGKVGESIYEKENWAKVIYYNEMSICHSGLTENSMSLGYAQAAVSILEKLEDKLKKIKIDKNIRKDRIFKLYTFALCNKGEAERNLHDYEKASRTFYKIINNFDINEKKSSDYYQALFRLALILIDQGRGKEAIKYLKQIKVRKEDDVRYCARDLERASALIDQKDFIGKKGAYKFLKPYITDKKSWENTFLMRKAKIFELRLIIEFKRNLPKDFYNLKKRGDIKRIREEYSKFKQTAVDLLNECVSREDENNFKKTCIYLADYFREEEKEQKEKIKELETKSNKKEKEASIRQEIDKAKGIKEKELRCYYLYLFNKLIFREKDKLNKKSISPDEIINDWILNETKNLTDLIYDYKKGSLVRFKEVLHEIYDDHYFRDFFDAYMNICKEKRYKPNKDEEKIVDELKKRLDDLYFEKDNLSELSKISESYNIYKLNLNEVETDKNNDDSKAKKDVEEDFVRFIRKCFFKGEGYCKNNQQATYLLPGTIVKTMQQNTDTFAEKIVGKTNMFRTGEFRGILTVLRRWNSFTPALASSVNPSKGGGYFLYFKFNEESLGIVIDPGYDFLDNFFTQGFRINDINVVIISHAHPDHSDDLPSILSLFHEKNTRLGKCYPRNKVNKKFNKKHLKLILSQGVFDQYYKIIKPSEESLEDIYVVQTGKKEKKNIPDYEHTFDKKHTIKIETFPTAHKDLSKWESLGFVIKINNNGIHKEIGYTSDAHWTKETEGSFINKFKNCDIVCAHLGSIIDILGGKEFCSLCEKSDINGNKKCKDYEECKRKNFIDGKPNKEKLLKQAQGQSHLYLSGLTMFFDKLLPPCNKENSKLELAIISEFGEELKNGIRMDLHHKFDDWFKERSRINENCSKARCFPSDIGLEIDIMSNNIYCSCCQEFKPKDKISPITYGKEEGIFFICDECNSVLSSYQIEEKLKDYYENGRKLELADD